MDARAGSAPVAGSQDQFRFLAELIPQLVWSTTPEGYHDYYNQRWYEYTGMPREGAQGWNWKNFLHPDDLDRAVEVWRHSLETGEPYEVEYRFKRARDGEYRWFIGRALPLRDARGDVVRWFGTCTDVHEEYTARQALQESEERFRSLFENSLDGVMLGAPDGTIHQANPAACAMLGYTEAEMRRLGRTGVLDTSDPRLAHALRERARTGRFHGELTFLRKDGSAVPVELSSSMYQDARGDTHTSVILRDVTERRRAEKRLRESEQRYRSVFQGAAEGLFLVGRDPDGGFRYIDMNPALEQIGGFERGQFVGRTPEEVFPSDGAAHLNALYGQVFQTGEPVTVEHTHDVPRGSITTEARYHPLRDGDGEVVQVLGTMVDITERKGAVEALRQSEERFRTVVEALGEGLVLGDLDDRILYANSRMAEITGYTPGELTGRVGHELLFPPGQWEHMRGVNAERAEGRESRYEMTLIRKDGRPVSVEIHGSPIRDASGRVAGTVGALTDVTEKRAREERMRMLTTALDTLQEGVSIADLEGTIHYANAAYRDILGIGSTAACTVHSFLPDEEARRQLAEIQQTLLRSGHWRGRWTRRRMDDGRVIPLDVIAGVVEGPRGDRRFLTIFHDASEKIAREQHLRRVERLASVGTLLSGVAHELNNPLSAVLGFAQLLLLEPRSDADRDDLLTIAREAERMAKIISDLRLVARYTPEDAAGTEQPVDLNDVVRHVLRTRDYSLKTRNIRTVEEPAPGLPPVLADRGQMEQVLLNLVINAEQALESFPGERRLTLRTRATASGVSVQVADTGPGIAPGHLDRIFDPFFTTKEPGEGTGLGLSLVHSIVSEHAGRIHVDSEPGRGTVFRIDLPAAPRASGEEAGPPAPSPGGRRLRVLVVDDEEAVRRVVVRHIQRRGHVVDEAPEGARALALLDGAKAPYDVIVSDLRMPGLDGEALLRHLRERGGGMADRVVFLTGDTASVQSMRTLSQARVPVLAKPSGIGQVAGVVEQLGAAASPPLHG